MRELRTKIKLDKSVMDSPNLCHLFDEVDLTTISEEVFDGFEVGTVVEHHGGESVAEDMWGALALRCDEAETAFDGFPHLR